MLQYSFICILKWTRRTKSECYELFFFSANLYFGLLVDTKWQQHLDCRTSYSNLKGTLFQKYCKLSLFLTKREKLLFFLCMYILCYYSTYPKASCWQICRCFSLSLSSRRCDNISTGRVSLGVWFANSIISLFLILDSGDQKNGKETRSQGFA